MKVIPDLEKIKDEDGISIYSDQHNFLYFSIGNDEIVALPERNADGFNTIDVFKKIIKCNRRSATNYSYIYLRETNEWLCYENTSHYQASRFSPEKILISDYFLQVYLDSYQGLGFVYLFKENRFLEGLLDKTTPGFFAECFAGETFRGEPAIFLSTGRDSDSLDYVTFNHKAVYLLGKGMFVSIPSILNTHQKINGELHNRKNTFYIINDLYAVVGHENLLEFSIYSFKKNSYKEFKFDAIRYPISDVLGNLNYVACRFKDHGTSWKVFSTQTWEMVSTTFTLTFIKNSFSDVSIKNGEMVLSSISNEICKTILK